MRLAGTPKGAEVTDTNGRFKRATPRKKTASVKRVTLSDDAKKKYEELVRVRDERAQTYGQAVKGPADRVALPPR